MRATIFLDFISRSGLLLKALSWASICFIIVYRTGIEHPLLLSVLEQEEL